MKLLKALHRQPMLIKVPALAALLMIVVSAVISERVLSRLSDNQHRHLSFVSDTFLDGLASALLPAVQRADVWEAFDAIDRAGRVYKAIKPETTVLADAGGRVLAANNPKAFPPLSMLPAQFTSRFTAGELLISDERQAAFVTKDVVQQGRHLGTIYSIFDISRQVQERKEILSTLIWTNCLLAALFAGLGYWSLRRLLEPVKTLSDHLRLAAEDEAREISTTEFPRKGSEFRPLFHGYNALVSAERERSQFEKQLHEEEKLASLGRLTSGMAHEINNPLGGMFSALDTLQRHGAKPEVRAKSVSLLKRGLSGIRDVVSSALLTYRPPKEPTALRPNDLEDIRLLLRPELRRKKLSLQWENSVRSEMAVDSTPIRQILLNILLNSIAASEAGGSIVCEARPAGDALQLTVEDDGPGLPKRILTFLNTDGPVSAPITDSAGLGLWIVKRLAGEMGGSVEANNLSAKGARISISIPLQREGLKDVA